MALTCGFFNSVDGDRKYDATQFASLFDGVITDGVVAAVGDFFATTPGGAMVVNVGSGRAWFNRTWTYSDAKIPLILDASDLLYDRIDAIVLEIDTSVAVRDNSIKVLKGTPAQEPQKPTLTNSGDIHQYALAYVRVKASTSEIGSGDITINVGQVDCPFVTSIVDTPDLEVLFAQWDAQFTAWFENVQAQLEGDVAANLQRQIDLKANKTDLGDFETPAKKLGLTGDLSVGASLGVLAKVGDLNVWRRTTSSGTDYPVSVNPNAYQTGDSGDGKPAGYTLGTEESKIICRLNAQSSFDEFVYNAESVNVSDDGTVSLNSERELRFNIANGSITNLNNSKGKFIRIGVIVPSNYSEVIEGIWYVPEDANFSVVSGYNGYVSVDKIQPVTGYPATPAGTTIEYLGQLGGKARMQIVSYIGTGTYGASNPCSITADFPMKIALCVGRRENANFYDARYDTSYSNNVCVLSTMKETFQPGRGFRNNVTGSPYGKKSSDDKTIMWYSTNSADGQLNARSYEYFFLCLG